MPVFSRQRGEKLRVSSRAVATVARPHKGQSEAVVELRDAVTVGEWLSLVEHLVRDQGVGGSNPLSPTIYMFVRSGNHRHRAVLRKIPLSFCGYFLFEFCVPRMKAATLLWRPFNEASCA